MHKSLRFILYGAIIAAVYALLTIAIAPIGSGLLQCRISEALCILPCFTPAAIPGLFIGCLLANLLMGNMPIDIVLGSLATLLSAACTYWIGKKTSGGARLLLAPLPAVLCNAFVVGWVLAYAYRAGAPYWMCALYVGIGQAIACYGAGLPLMKVLEKYRVKVFG